MESVAQEYRCKYCGAEVKRIYKTGKRRLRPRKNDTFKYCSKRCRGDHRMEITARRATHFLDVGTLIVWDYQRTTLKVAVQKIDSAFKKAQRIKIRNASKLLKIDRRVTNDCVRCGCQFKTIKVCVKMCVRCRAMVYKKQQRHHKRCEAKGLPYDPSVTMEFIGERANWKCEICGKQCLRHFKWLPVGDNL